MDDVAKDNLFKLMYFHRGVLFAWPYYCLLLLVKAYGFGTLPLVDLLMNQGKHFVNDNHQSFVTLIIF